MIEALRKEVRRAADAVQEAETLLSNPTTEGTELYMALIRLGKAVNRAKALIEEAAGG